MAVLAVRKAIAPGLLGVAVIAGCAQQPPSTPRTEVQQAPPETTAIDQASLCEVSAWAHDDVAKACERGQKVVFLPNRWGNEQLPVIFAAVNCDLRYSVALTNGAVACIYGPITPRPAPPVESASPVR